MTTDPIIEKIKKLLRMKRGGTAAEIETALNLARELAEKHGIDLGNVNPDEETNTRPLTHKDAILSSRLQWECKYAMLICEMFFNVTGLLRSSLKNPYTRQFHITFIGTEWDIQIATYVFKFLAGHFRREWNSRKGRLRNRQAFMYGMYHGLSSKLDAERKTATVPDSSALVRIEQAVTRRNNYMEQTFGETRKEGCAPEGDAGKAKWAGFLAGRDTEIRQGVGSNERNSLLLN